jgi:uncharacterized phage-associated protein
MPVDVSVLANSILDRGQRDGISIDPMKLQKLVYLTNGWHMLFFGQPLISADIEAWRYGPVIPDLYREFKEFKGSPITRHAQVAPGVISTSKDEESLIDSVWEVYKNKSGIYLSMLTHEPGYAWDIARKEGSGWCSPVISNRLILDEFSRRQKAAEGTK